MTRERVSSVPVEAAVMRWLRESAGWTSAEAGKRLGLREETYLNLESGGKTPTLRQIELLAKAFRRPVAAFLLPAPPEEPQLPQDFRLIPPSGKKKEFSRKLRRVFRRARWLQNLSRELMTNLSFSIEPTSLQKRRLSDNPATIAASEREASGITLEQQMKWKDSYKAFNAWRNYLEGKNIRAFQISMPPEEARGFSLTDKKPHLLAVNTADDINARIFTLFHEYAHLLLSETGVCIPEFAGADSTQAAKVERWCNRFAAEFLLPQQAKRHLVVETQAGRQQIGLGKLLGKYSAKFKVSKYALFVRMKEFGMVTDVELNQFVETLKKTERRKGGFGRGLTQLDRCNQEKGSNYVSLVLENLDRGLINTRDALDYLSIRMKYLDSLRSRQRGVKNG